MKSYRTTYSILFFFFILLMFPANLRPQEGFQTPDYPGEGVPLHNIEPHVDTGPVADTDDNTDVLFPEYEVEVFRRIVADGDVVFPFVHNGYLYSFSLKGKIPLWRIFIGGDLVNPFTVHDGHVYFYDIYNRVYSIDLNEGQTHWKVYIEHEIKGKLLIYDNYMIVSTLNGDIYVIDRSEGSIVYTHNSEGKINAGLSIYERLVIVPYKNGKIAAYDMETRNEEWSFNSGGIISVSPVIRDEYLYFGSWDDTFYALDIHTGEPVWISYVGDAITRDFIVFENEIILFFAKGEMVCLNRGKGDIRWVKYLKNIEFDFNYFTGQNIFFIFIPDFIALNPDDGNIIFDYRERSFHLYKEMLFDNMVEGIYPLSDDERIRLLSEEYFTVSNYPHLPPATAGENYVYFITDNAWLYVYDLEKDFFILKFKMS